MRHNGPKVLTPYLELSLKLRWKQAVEIVRGAESMPWVRCASGNVYKGLRPLEMKALLRGLRHHHHRLDHNNQVTFPGQSKSKSHSGHLPVLRSQVCESIYFHWRRKINYGDLIYTSRRCSSPKMRTMSQWNWRLCLQAQDSLSWTYKPYAGPSHRLRLMNTSDD